MKNGARTILVAGMKNIVRVYHIGNSPVDTIRAAPWMKVYPIVIG